MILPTYGRMVNEILTYKQGWSTPKTELDLQYNKPDIPGDQLKATGQSLNEEP